MVFDIVFYDLINNNAGQIVFKSRHVFLAGPELFTLVGIWS